MKRKFRNAVALAAGALAGVGFMVLAGVSIQFEESVGQKLAHFSHGAADISRKLFSS
ncbi:MAG: hypothetical protein ABL883_07150 [Terricaulis sp.]